MHQSICVCGRAGARLAWRPAGLLLLLASVSGCLPAQALMGGLGRGPSVVLFSNDRAVLEAGDPRKDLPCTLTHEKPVLGFDLKFHASFDVSVPLNELSGTENMLTIVFRVIPEAEKDEPRYFTQKIRVPSIADDAKGEAFLEGGFELGEGKYHIDWLIRDRSERVCSAYWDVEAALSSKDKQITMMLGPNAVQASEFEQFREEPPVERNPDSPLSVKMLVNFAPQNARSAALQPIDISALVSILRTIARDPRIGKFSLVAFNMQDQKVLYRQEDSDKIDFPSIGKALGALKLGTVDLGKLAKKHSDTEFLAGLMREELKVDRPPDALIFAGPKAMLDENVSQDALREVGEIHYPIFYMNYNLSPQQVPWRDSISHAIKHFRGTEYTISRPRDLWYAVSEMVSRVAKSRPTRRAQVQGVQ
ncbi:MAG: acetyltransferase [Acidobacteria bacterium]|nr:acetyltransferase [Acidobacteriota bacterium]